MVEIIGGLKLSGSVIRAGDPCPVCKMPAPADGIAGHTATCHMLGASSAAEKFFRRAAQSASNRARFVGVNGDVPPAVTARF